MTSVVFGAGYVVMTKSSITGVITSVCVCVCVCVLGVVRGTKVSIERNP